MICSCLLAGAGYAGVEYALKPVSDEQFVKLARKAWSVEPKIERADGGRFGVVPDGRLVVLTGDYAAPSGYRGPTSLLLMLDAERTQLEEAMLVESCDSPPYVKRALRKGMVKQLAGMQMGSDGAIELDAVSGATRTCRSVEQAVNATLQRVCANEMNDEGKAKE